MEEFCDGGEVSVIKLWERRRLMGEEGGDRRGG